MMDFQLLLKGFLIGFSIAAPVGQIGVLCIRRTLVDGRAAGFVSGLGAASADAIYGGIAGFGLTVISSFLVSQQTWFRLVGGIFLLYLGLRIFRTAAAQIDTAGRVEMNAGRLLGAYTSTFFLTLTNPMTILSFVAIFAGLGYVNAGRDAASAGWLVLGVFLGSSLWWLLLSTGIGSFRSRFRPLGLRWVNRVSGGVIAGFGLVALASLVL